MAHNPYQKIVLLDINASAQAAIENQLALGKVIVSVTNLQPAVNKLLIVYVDGEFPPDNP